MKMAEPKIFEPFYIIPGRTPRNVAIDRLLKKY